MADGSLAPIAFSTLACPEWSAETVVTKAAAFGFDGIEWRGGPDGTVRTNWTNQRRRDLRRSLEQAGISSIAVTSYPNLISSNPAERTRSIVEIVDHARLARDLGAPAVRVFFGIADDAPTDDEVYGRVTPALEEALWRTRDTDIAIAIEPHDDHVLAERVRPLLETIPDRRLGVVWDIANAWSAGERPEAGIAAYEDRIAWVQVKDGTGGGPTWRLCELGAGDVPLEDALHRLVASATSRGAPVPPISLEWERAWHPELAPADVALPAARRWFAERFHGRSGGES